MRSTVLDILPYLTAIISYMQHLQIELVLSSVEMFSSLAGNYEKHALRVSQGIAAVAGSRADTDFDAAPPIPCFYYNAFTGKIYGQNC